MAEENQAVAVQDTEETVNYTITPFLYAAAGVMLSTMPERIRRHKSQELLKDIVRLWQMADEATAKELGHSRFRLTSVDVFEDSIEPHWERRLPGFYGSFEVDPALVK